MLIEKQVKEKPQFTPRAILVDGNGIFHPRKAGIACFVGVRTGIPTIGIGIVYIKNLVEGHPLIMDFGQGAFEMSPIAVFAVLALILA